MCRVLFAVGNGEEIAPLIDALVKASENDPYKEARGKGKAHRDGWGYALLKKDSLTHYRSSKPIFEDIEGVERLKDSLNGFLAVIAHTRAASQGAKNPFNAQPFAFSSRKGFSFWLYHNGDLNKSEIIKLADFEEAHFEKASDSYAMGAYLCRKLESFEVDEVLKHYSVLAKTANTSLNTGTLFLTPSGRATGFVTAYSKPTYLLKRENWDYVRQIVLRKENLFAMSSSTLELYHEVEWRNAVNGTAFYVDIDLEREAFSLRELVLG
ncbi:class II glutamine amidotransferase [Thermococcus sp. Bubb.Bath]|uniref:class II glutamine amidotransferase n=1 Tax=Thermococcus sp. Bubb.Bath TaxID=1638242 RepID=UPI00143BB29C|nr:class II glutamine amidotransferase [Thermococcus sp. Bubb.Bath]NJF24426.1 class II glutamine amidotransferase [Thermococcus sp. Bubb.Bath]